MRGHGISAEKFLHLDGWNGWRLARASPEIDIGEDGLTLGVGELPPPPPLLLRSSTRPRHRGLAFDASGRAIAVAETGRGLGDAASSCDGVPAPWGLDERIRIGGMATDARGRLFVALPELGELRVLRLSPPGELARLPMNRPVAVAVDARGTIYVLDTAEVVVLSPSLRELRRVAVPGGETIAASGAGDLLVVSGGSSEIHVAEPGGAFAAFELGRPVLPAIAFENGDGGTLCIGDEPSRRVVRWSRPRLQPLAWSRTHGDYAALARRSTDPGLFALGPGLTVARLEFEADGFRSRRGEVILGPLDSGMPGVEWHRVTAMIRPEPDGASDVAVEVVASDDCTAFDLDARWGERRDFVAPGRGGPAELALRRVYGRHAYIRLTLRGDGRRAPTLRWLRVEYPRDSYLRYLPEMFSEDRESRDITARFLSIFEAEYADLGRRISELPRLFRPLASDPEYLPWLAARIGLLLDDRWPVEKQRDALARALPLYRRRGTRAAFETFLTDYGAPGLRVIEGFRERTTFILGHSAVLGCNAILQGGCNAPRVVLGRGIRLGTGRLDSRPYAEVDPLVEGRGELVVIVPLAVAARADVLDRVERIAALEAPAGASVRVVTVAPGFRLGIGARVGITTSLGAHRPWRLPAGDDPPRALPMLLTREPRVGAELVVGRGSRLGMDSTV